MSTALAWCRQRPCNQGVTLHAHRGNAGALRWFRRFGFERVADESLRTTQLVAMELRADALPGQDGAGRGFPGKAGIRDTACASARSTDRKRVVSGKRGSVRVDLGGRRILKKKIKTKTITRYKLERESTT